MLESLQSRFDLALHASREATASWIALGNVGEASAAQALGARALLSVGRSEDALSEAMAALDAAHRYGDARALMNTTLTVGHVFYGLQRFDEARTYFERALQTARALEDRVTEGGLLDAVACVHGSKAAAAGMDASDTGALLTAAIALWDRASQIARETGHRRNEAAALANQAEALVLLDRAEEALSLLRSWTIDPERDRDRIVWHHRDVEGVVCMRLGRYAEAIERFTEALRFADGSAQTMVVCEHLSDAFERAGDLTSALAYHKRFHALYKQVASEAAQRSASVAAVELQTVEAQAQAVEQRDRAERLAASNDQLARRADDLARISLEDPLTGLANRRMMDKLIAADSQGFAVAMVDADHFKRINDGWSHAIGDEVLRRLAALIRGACRVSDTPVRFGGEEFAILLRHLGEDGALHMAERVRRTIEAFDWTTIAPKLAVTVSVGVAAAHEADSTAGVIALADQRLYAAKRAGRNRVVGRRGHDVARDAIES